MSIKFSQAVKMECVNRGVWRHFSIAPPPLMTSILVPKFVIQLEREVRQVCLRLNIRNNERKERNGEKTPEKNPRSTRETNYNNSTHTSSTFFWESTIELLDIECVLCHVTGFNLTEKFALINPPFWIFFKNYRLLLHKMSWVALINPPFCGDNFLTDTR